MYHYLHSHKAWDFVSLNDSITSLLAELGMPRIQDVAICICIKGKNDEMEVRYVAEYFETILVVEYPDGKKTPIIPKKYEV